MNLRTDEDARPPRETPPGKEPLEWYHRSWVIAAAIFFFGPLALPLIWTRPGVPLILKISVTVAVLALTVLMIKSTSDYYRLLLDNINEMSEALARG